VNQSGGRLAKDEKIDNLYRFFVGVYKEELNYLPDTQIPDLELA
jgi:hypothetical protein